MNKIKCLKCGCSFEYSNYCPQCGTKCMEELVDFLALEKKQLKAYKTAKLFECSKCRSLLIMPARICHLCGASITDTDIEWYYTNVSELTIFDDADRDSYLATYAYMDNKPGILKLLNGKLVFDGDDEKDSVEILVSDIKKHEYTGNDTIYLTIKGKFLVNHFSSEVPELWMQIIEDAINGNYYKIDTDAFLEIIREQV